MTADSQARGRALVLGSDTRAFLTVIRSLGRSGVSVDVAWCPPDAIALRSRYVARVHALPLPGTDGWLDAFRAHLRRERYDLVVPCDDPSLLPLQAHAESLADDARIYLLRPDVFAIVNDKARTYDLAARLGVSVPRQEDVTRATDAEGLAARLGLPLVLKPTSSFTLGALHRKREVRVLRTVAEVATAIEGLRDDTALAQTFFEGVGRGVEVLAADGEVLVAFQHRRVHEPLDGGGSSYRASERPDPALLGASRALIGALRYTGVAMIEFKQSTRTGDWILVEINGRFWGSLPLAVAAGADFPAHLYDLLVNGRRIFPATYRIGVHARNWERDLGWLTQHLGAVRRGRRDVPHPLRTLAGELAHVVTGRERSDTLTLDDPRPGLGELGAIVAHYGGAVTRKLGARLAETGASRRRAERRALAAWRDARTVLFVCKGNICRSPFAEAYARGVDATRTYTSSGFYPIAQRPSPENAVASSALVGVDLDAHRSSLLDDATLAAAEAIFVFDHSHVREIATRFPHHRHRVHFLGALDRNGGIEIPDPYGESVERFSACYARIARAVDRGVRG